MTGPAIPGQDLTHVPNAIAPSETADIIAGMTLGDVSADDPTDIAVSRVVDFAALEAKWRDLEGRSGQSFFQSWTWTGCLAEERFPDPVLVEARENGRTVALALFNRRGRRLYLGESGDPALDCIFIEFNGVLTESGREARLTAACLTAARAWSGARRFRPPLSHPGSSGGGRPDRPLSLPGLSRRNLVLSGVDAVTAELVSDIGAVRRRRSLPAPFLDAGEVGDGFLQRRSANTRQQIRRSNRGYATFGAIATERADSLERAYAFLDGLEHLHQKSWVARGRPGAFANPFFGHFHRTLIARGLERGEIDLLRVSAGTQTIGFLYNFRYRGRSFAYQSGFDYEGAGRHEKPGLTCHYEAIRHAARWGAVRYDFLAGDDRYKRSLSNQMETLHWIDVVNPWSPGFLARCAWEFLVDRLRGRMASPIDSPLWHPAVPAPPVREDRAAGGLRGRPSTKMSP